MHDSHLVMVLCDKASLRYSDSRFSISAQRRKARPWNHNSKATNQLVGWLVIELYRSVSRTGSMYQILTTNDRLINKSETNKSINV